MPAETKEPAKAPENNDKDPQKQEAKPNNSNEGKPTSSKPDNNNNKPPSENKPPNNAPTTFESYFQSASPTFVESTPPPTRGAFVAWLPELTAGTAAPTVSSTDAPTDVPTADGSPTVLPTYVLAEGEEGEVVDMVIAWHDDATNPPYLDSIQESAADSSGYKTMAWQDTALISTLISISTIFILSTIVTLIKMRRRVVRRKYCMDNDSCSIAKECGIDVITPVIREWEGSVEMEIGR